jgi:transposase-like protein
MAERLRPVIADLVKGRKSNGRCVYNRKAKRALVEAALLPGVSVARLALDHAVNANLLRKWIRAYQAKHTTAPRGSERSVALLPVIATEPLAAAASAAVTSSDALIEIALGDATVRVRGAVDAQQLRTVIDCLARRT